MNEFDYYTIILLLLLILEIIYFIVTKFEELKYLNLLF